MQSWRIKAYLNDKTSITSEQSSVQGAVVVVSPKGAQAFKKFSKGATQDIIDFLGYPCSDYPEIQDAIDANNKMSLWIASVSDKDEEVVGKHGAIIVTTDGQVLQPDEGYDDSSTSETTISKIVEESFSQTLNFTPQTITNVGSYTISDDSTTSFEIEFDENVQDTYVSATISLDGEELETQPTLSWSNGVLTISSDTAFTQGTYSAQVTLLSLRSQSFVVSELENVTISNCKLSLGTTTIDCTITKEGSVLTIVSTTPFTENVDYVFSCTYNEIETYNIAFVLFNACKQEDDYRVTLTKSDDVDEAFNLIVERNDDLYGWTEFFNEDVSLDENGKDGNGSNIYIGNMFKTSDYTLVPQVINNDIDWDTIELSDESVELSGGVRGHTVTKATLLATLSNTTKYNLRFIFDCSGTSAPVVAMQTLRSNSQKYCSMIYCTPNISADEILENPSLGHFGVTSERGMICLGPNNWGKHVDAYNGNDFICSNVGLYVGKLVDMHNNKSGAPMWVNKNGDVGGQLGSSITELCYEDIDEDTLEELDSLGFNPVINDYTYGVMVVSQRTRQVKKTVMSYIAQSFIVDTIMSRVLKEVLPEKIGAMLDEDTYNEVSTQGNSIMRQYSKAVEDYIFLCSTDNNSDTDRANQHMNVDLGMILRGYAETITFNVSLGNNGVDVKELVGL